MFAPLRFKSIFMTSVLALSATIGFNSAASAQELTTENLGPAIREYLLANPEVIIEAMTIYQSQEEEREQAAAEAAISTQGELIYASATSPVIGSADAPYTIVEFFDYQCGYCKRAAEGLFQTLQGRDDIKIVMKEFPILGAESTLAAQAALAAKMQGKYDDMHWAMLRFKGRLSDRAIMAIAKENGLDTDKLRADMSSSEVQAEITETANLARSLNIGGTPAFIVADQLIPGAVPADQLVALAESQ